MTTVAILPVSDASGEKLYRAIALGARYANAGDKQSTGKTAGEALSGIDCPVGR
jgi:hypothetical protein